MLVGALVACARGFSKLIRVALNFTLFQWEWVCSRNVTTAGRLVGRLHHVCPRQKISWTLYRVQETSESILIERLF